jgi:predicted lipoprotein with Yx(FWY)xxD motif
MQNYFMKVLCGTNLAIQPSSRCPEPSISQPDFMKIDRAIGALSFLAVLAGCGSESPGPTPPDDGGSPEFQVDSVTLSPAGALWPDIVAYFNQPVDPASITVASVTVSRAGVSVPASIQVSQDTRSVQLKAAFLPATTYTVSIAGTVRSGASAPLGTTRSFTLTTRNAVAASVAATNVFAVEPIVVQANGYVHLITFADGTMYYSSCAARCSIPGNWQSAVVDDSTMPDGNASLAIDQSGALHVSYHATSPSSLRYARCVTNCTATAGWQTARVDSTENQGTESAIALDGAGQVHIAYNNFNARGLWYALCSSSCLAPADWSTTQLVSTLLDSREPSLAVSPSGAVHAMVRGQESNYPIYYLECSTGCTDALNWQKVQFAESFLGFGGSLEVDTDGRRHVAYFEKGTTLRYATCATGCLQLFNWTRVNIDQNGGGVLTALARGVDGRLAIAYGSTNGALNIATCMVNCTTGTQWQKGPVVGSTNSGVRPDLGLDAAGQPHIKSNAAIPYLD